MDDNKFIRNGIVTLIINVLSNLQINDVEILELSDGIELLYVIIKDSNRIKYVFIDENMEFMNGSESVRIIRKMEKDNKINKFHIVSLTAFEDDYYKNLILDSGVNSIIPKPCTKYDISKIFNDYSKI